MSEKFRFFVMPCKECIVQAICKDKDQIDTKEVSKRYIAIPKWDRSKKSHHKGLLECWANLGWDIISAAIGKVKTAPPNTISITYINYLIELSGLIQWIVNSKSWEDGEEHSFDINEIRYKAEQSMKWIPKS